jgi:hypothetical protein
MLWGGQMGNETTDKSEKIILPKNTQREMIKFFHRYAKSKNAEPDKKQQQAPKNSNDRG